jgi:hypothetical protein
LAMRRLIRRNNQILKMFLEICADVLEVALDLNLSSFGSVIAHIIRVADLLYDFNLRIRLRLRVGVFASRIVIVVC